MAKSQSIAPRLPPGLVPLRSLLSITPGSTSQATMVDTESTHNDYVPSTNDAASSMANSAQSDNNVLTIHDTESNPPEH